MALGSIVDVRTRTHLFDEADMILGGVDVLGVLKRGKALAMTPMIGRTHGIMPADYSA
jgi:hypothetical protein